MFEDFIEFIDQHQQLIEWLYWTAGITVAILAVVALFRQAKQERADFMLRLYERWENLSTARSSFGNLYKLVRDEALQQYPGISDDARRRKFGGIGLKKIKEWETNGSSDGLEDLLTLLSFFELLGQMVRRGYIPIIDVYDLYKGPIIQVASVTLEYVDEWANRSNVPPGLLRNFKYLVIETNKLSRRER